MSQLTRADLKHMSAHDILTAREQGQLADLLGEPPATRDAADKARAGQPLTRTDIAELYKARRYDLITAANAAGQITTEGDDK
ncbi:hypothetical protein [Micromonospora globbae]|uniref:hypothetical protein n=1 Tax=Micromonospora globbae TaxID=1894969 RepID=UPI0034179EF0